MSGVLTKILQPRRNRIAKNKAIKLANKNKNKLAKTETNLELEANRLIDDNTINIEILNPTFNKLESDGNERNFNLSESEEPLTSLENDRVIFNNNLTAETNQTNSLQQKLVVLLEMPFFCNNADECFEKFLGKLELQSAKLNYNEEEKLFLLASRLNGPVSEEFLKFVNNNPTVNWIQAITFLQNNQSQLPKEATTTPFFKASQCLQPEAVSIQTLQNLKQSDFNSLEAYAKQIKIMVNKLFTNKMGYNNHIRVQNYKKYFISGITPQLRQQLKPKMKTLNTFENLLQEAVNFNKDDQRHSPTQQNFKNQIGCPEQNFSKKLSQAKLQSKKSPHKAELKETSTKAECHDPPINIYTMTSTTKEKFNKNQLPQPFNNNNQQNRHRRQQKNQKLQTFKSCRDTASAVNPDNTVIPSMSNKKKFSRQQPIAI